MFEERGQAAVNFNAYASVTPNEAQPLVQQIGKHAAALWVGVGGNVSITGTDGKTVILYNVPSGTLLPIHVVVLNAAGTTASQFVALYRV